MKPPLRSVCALLYAVACYAGQANSIPQNIQPSPGKPPLTQAPAREQALAPATPAASPQDPPKSSAPLPGEIKPGCDAEKPPPADSAAKAYVIGALDVLDIRVWNNPNLSGTFDVQPDGMISMPLIGQLKADGVTVMDLTRTIRNRLAISVFECPPEVNIQVVRVNSKKYYIYGGILHQGEFPLNSEMTVLDAFANCGGFKDFANLKKIYILRGNEKLKFNYKEVSQGKSMDQNIKLQNGDRIFVPE